MKTVLHKAESRGHAYHGWLDSHHTFSFANYYNPERIHFGVLRVLNDDVVQGGMGFPQHPHDNMEIISIPLEGELEHQDSMGNKFVIKKNDVQVMSAGTGIFHSEKNKHKDKAVKFLQIWVFPREKNIKPRYDQITYDPAKRHNQWQRIVAPDEAEAVSINQDAYFSLGQLDAGKTLAYDFALKGNGLYVFVLEGKVSVEGQPLNKRDGLGIWEIDKITVEAQEIAEVLLMEVPMSL
jgi:quercetin 2,3-dioxygenase